MTKLALLYNAKKLNRKIFKYNSSYWQVKIDKSCDYLDTEKIIDKT